jgi:hypothetical protein
LIAEDGSSRRTILVSLFLSGNVGWSILLTLPESQQKSTLEAQRESPAVGGAIDVFKLAL